MCVGFVILRWTVS